MKSVQNYFDTTGLDFSSEASLADVLRGQYNDFAKTMNTALVLLIKWDRKLVVHGVIHIHTNTEGIQFAKTTIDFNERIHGSIM